MFGQPHSVRRRAQRQRREDNAARGASRMATSSSPPTSPAPTPRSPSVGLSPAPAMVIATAEGGERPLLTPTADRTDAVLNSPMAASDRSAATAPRAAVATAVTTTAYTSDDDDQSLVENVPKIYVCPITHEIMENPVSDSLGHSYEKAAIERWLNENNTSPVTGLWLPNKTLTLNHTLRSVIEEWKSSRPSPSVLGDASSRVNRTHRKKTSRKKPKTGHKSSLAEQFGVYKNTLPELVDRMTDDADVLEAVAIEMFALRGELDTTSKELAEAKSNLVESNRIFNRECIVCLRDISWHFTPFVSRC